nr:MAG TPA: hypothetical protein [Caudoviricetes sp.]
MCILSCKAIAVLEVALPDMTLLFLSHAFCNNS